MVNFPRCNRCHHQPTRASNISTKCIKITHIEAEKGMLFGGRGLHAKANNSCFEKVFVELESFVGDVEVPNFWNCGWRGLCGFLFFFVCLLLLESYDI